MGTMTSQITSLTILYSPVCSGAYQRKHQSSTSLAFVRGIHQGPVNYPHKWPVTRKMFPFDDVIISFYVALATRKCHVRLQTPRKLFMLYRTENQFFTTFSIFKHGYIKKFYWSSQIFHWSSHLFISRGPRTDKFRGV